jgi:hypothetical protein
MATIKSSDLDFDQIKSKLKTYFRQQSEFTDYDFDASGLSNILDVLAYNTHINGLIANFSLNESFLSTSQLRSSALAHAETLGYFPRSKTGAFAELEVSVLISNTPRPSSVTLPAYTSFTASIGSQSYSFQTIEAFTATPNRDGLYQFKTSDGNTTLRVVEGSLKTKTFIVGETRDDQIYVIPDPNLDTSTMLVRVYDSPTSTSFETYLNINNIIRLNALSAVYQIREVPNGYYEISFSNYNLVGKTPLSGNKIVIQYLSSSGPDANDAEIFVPENDLTINGLNYPLIVTPLSASAGGSEKETIQSIKTNAPVAFASQRRMVTAQDYEALILSNYSSVVDDVIAWGGNDNVPPVYGRVYVSLKFANGVSSTIQEQTKNNIISTLSESLAIMSIDTVFADPVTTFLELQTFFNFDPSLSGLSDKSVETRINTLISNYFSNNLNQFTAVFRRSALLAQIDNFSPAILDTRINVKIQQRFIPVTNASRQYTLSFPVQLAQPDDVNRIITTTRFTFSGQTCTIKNQFNSTKLQIYNLFDDVIVDNIGYYDPIEGLVSITGFAPTAYEGDVFKVSALPANLATIRPLRNYILNIDNSVSFARAVIDTQNTSVTL